MSSPVNRKRCAAVAKSKQEACKNRTLPWSRYCIWHIEKPPLICGALIGAILGYVFNWVLPSPELSELRQLREDVKPLIFLAESTFPSLGRSQAIEELTKQVKELRAKVAENEFTPLKPDLRTSTLSELALLSPEFNEKNIQILITYETWVTPPTREFAEQLAALLREAHFAVSGPEFATVYLVSAAFPLEWGFNEQEEITFTKSYRVLSRIIEPDKKHAARRKFQAGRLRIHFAGKPVFRENGLVAFK